MVTYADARPGQDADAAGVRGEDRLHHRADEAPGPVRRAATPAATPATPATKGE